MREDPRKEFERLRESGDTTAALGLVREHGVPARMLPDHKEGSQEWWDELDYLLDMELKLTGR